MIIITYNEFNSIPKCRIHQSSQCLSQFHRYFLRRKRENRRQWHNGKEVEHEDCHWVPSRHTGNDSKWHEDKENVYVAAQQRNLCNRKPCRRVPNQRILALVSRRGRLRKDRAPSILSGCCNGIAIKQAGALVLGRHLVGGGTSVAVRC